MHAVSKRPFISALFHVNITIIEQQKAAINIEQEDGVEFRISLNLSLCSQL